MNAIPVRTHVRVLLITLAWLVLAATPAEASQKAIWGPVLLPNGDSAFPVYRELGVDVFQIQLTWSRVATTRPSDPTSPSDPAYRWPSALDDAVKYARDTGIKVAIMVKDTPAWANGGKGSSWPPNDDRDYANFLQAAASRYDGVRHWMIWGETNRAAVWQPLPADSKVGPRRYALLLDASYRALKRSNRRNKVIGGMTFTFGDVTPDKWVRWMRLPDGSKPRLDYYGHNPFARRTPKLSQDPYYPGARDISDVDTFAREVHRAYRRTPRFRRRGPRLWMSEFSVSSDRANRAFDFFVSREDQARWLTTAFRIADRHRYIAAIGWFSLLDEPLSVARGLTTGLMTYDGFPKPSFYAYRRAR
jgi:hypothetical protein